MKRFLLVFGVVFTSQFVLGQAHAGVIALNWLDLIKRVAIPSEFLAIESEHDDIDFDGFAKEQARLECLNYFCGENPCQSVVSFKYDKGEVRPDASYWVKSDDGTHTLFERGNSSEIQDKIEYYWDSILCSSESELTTSSKQKQREVDVDDLTYQMDGVLAVRNAKEPDWTSPMSAAREVVDSHGSLALSFAKNVAIQGLANYLATPTLNDTFMSGLAKTIFAYTGFHSVFNQGMQSVITEQREDLTPEAWLQGSAKKKREVSKLLDQVKLTFETRKNEKNILSQNIQYIQEELDLIEKFMNSPALGMMNGGLVAPGLDHLLNSLSGLDTFLKIPTQIQAPQEGWKEKISELFANLDPTLRYPFEGIVAQVLATSNGSFKSSGNYYFVGAPGTGKTYMAKGIAEAFGLPFKKLELNKGLAVLLDQIDLFLEQCPFKNPIILIDEAGDFLKLDLTKVSPNADVNVINTMKILLDPDNTTLSAYHLESKFRKAKYPSLDTSRVTWILTGNHQIGDSALKSRLKVINFPKISPSERFRIAEIIFKRITGNAAPDSAKEVLNRIVAETDKRFEGVREMEQIIRSYASITHGGFGEFNLDEELKRFESPRKPEMPKPEQTVREAIPETVKGTVPEQSVSRKAP